MFDKVLNTPRPQTNIFLVSQCVKKMINFVCGKEISNRGLKILHSIPSRSFENFFAGETCKFH